MSRSASASEGLVDRDLGIVEVVLQDEAAVVLHVAQQLVELEADEPGVDPELDDVGLDLLGDAAHHLAALQHRDHVAHGHEVFDLEHGERGRAVVEPALVALERLQRLVGPVEQPGDLLQQVLDRARRRRR